MTLAKDGKKQAEASALVSLDQLIEKHQTTRLLLEDHLQILHIEVQKIEDEYYLTTEQVCQLDEYYERLLIGWAVSLAKGLHREFRGP